MPKPISQDDFLMQLSEKLKGVGIAPNIKKYKPHAKQYEYHASAAKKKLYIGGNRSGKTTGGVCEDIWRSTKRHPYRPDLNAINEPIRGRVIGVDFTQGVEKILFPQFKQWLYPSAIKGGAWEVAYNKTLRELTFENGSTIEFMSYDQDLDKFAGTSRHWIHFDEEPPNSIFIENMARLIDTNGDYWITMTPVEGMTWVHEDLYEPHVGKENAEVLVVEVNTLENPYLSSEAISSFVSGVSEDDVVTRIQGQFVQQGGRVYKKFDPTPGGMHVLKDTIDRPEVTFANCMWLMGLDHGLNNPTAVLWAAVDSNGFIVVFAEHYRKNASIKEHAAEIRRREKEWKRGADLRVADPSIKNRNPVSMTSIHEEYMKYGVPFILGNNDVKSGIVRTKRYFDPEKLVGHKTKFYEELGRDEVPRILVTPDCVNFIAEHKKYRWKTYVAKKQQFENNPYDEPHKKDDHTCDTLRYMIMTRPDLRADNESLKDRVDEALDNLDLGDFGVSSPGLSDIVDPMGRMTNGWSYGDNAPAKGGDPWEYDEHMGSGY